MDRTCTKCKQIKPIDQYARQRNGYRGNCKSCDRERKQRYYDKEQARTAEARAIGKAAYEQKIAEARALREARQAVKRKARLDYLAAMVAMPKKTDDPATWTEYNRRYKARIKNTWRWFFCVRWSSINRRTINGKNPRWDKPIQARYLKKGTELRMTRREFGNWCYLNREEIERMYREGLNPSVDRIDRHGHYEIKNIQLLPFLDNCRKDSNLAG